MTEATIGHNEPKNKDWIAVYRSLRTHPIVGFLNPDGTRRKGAVLCDTMAWIDLCMQANWKDLRENNKGHPVIVERGQLQGGRAWLAQRWGWTEKKVRIFLKKLTDDKMVILGPARGPEQRPVKRNVTNIITICNYDIYQTSIEILDSMEATKKATERASEGPARGHTVTKEQDKQVTTLDTRSRLDLDILETKLFEAANGAMASPAVAPKVLILSDPINWIESGCDLELDILPAVKARAHKMRPGSVKSWSYFTEAVADAKAARQSPMPEGRAPPPRSETSEWHRKQKAARDLILRKEPAGG